LESLSLKVIRFSNLDVMQRFHDVCGTIHEMVEARTAQKPFGFRPHSSSNSGFA
jgi:very-short-patch-repair endonuclease